VAAERVAAAMQALAGHPSTVPDPQAMTKPRPTVLDYHHSYLAGAQMLLCLCGVQGVGGGEDVLGSVTLRVLCCVMVQCALCSPVCCTVCCTVCCMLCAVCRCGNPPHCCRAHYRVHRSPQLNQSLAVRLVSSAHPRGSCAGLVFMTLVLLGCVRVPFAVKDNVDCPSCPPACCAMCCDVQVW
jgi:hypothetical protein